MTPRGHRATVPPKEHPMTTHVDFALRSDANASVQFTAAPFPMTVKISRATGEDLATFTPQDAAGPRPLPGGALRVSAFYAMGGGAWIPLDVDLNEDTAARAVFRCSAYVGSTMSGSPTTGGSTKLEAILTVTK
jgi:hypothetical protein